jgi:hypothetical protein
MQRVNHVGYGVTFGLSLILSWLLVTPFLMLAFWSGPHTRDELTKWVGLWIFTVGAPTLQAIRLHRRLNDLLQMCPTVAGPVRRELAYTRFALLMFGSMTVLMVISLIGK